MRLTAPICCLLSALCGPPLPCQEDASANPSDSTAQRTAVVSAYAECCHRLYWDSAAAVGELQTAVSQLLANPDATTLAAARAAWVRARQIYVQTEALRFYDGPIDAIEGQLNAWPLDEAFVDYVVGAPDSGIINDRVRHPHIAETVLLFVNENGGEANVSVGWHAIEFLLWGQDRRDDGPGDRPASDYVVGEGQNAERRREYLQVITRLLRRQLEQLATAWAPDADNYRRRFEADPSAAVRKMFTGITILTAFELTGERLAVAYETQDQEQEHSCFSDTTWQDFEANQLGIVRLMRGDPKGGKPGLLTLVAGADAKLASSLDRQLTTTLACIRAIPQPFDMAMRGADDAPGRIAIRKALEALEQQTELLTFAGNALGFELPLQPAGVR